MQHAGYGFLYYMSSTNLLCKCWLSTYKNCFLLFDKGPSPASNFTVVSRQKDRFDLSWTNSGESTNCIVWADEAPNATTLCDTGNNTAVITNLPTPGKLYTIHIVIQSDQLDSTVSSISERTSKCHLPAIN